MVRVYGAVEAAGTMESYEDAELLTSIRRRRNLYTGRPSRYLAVSLAVLAVVAMLALAGMAGRGRQTSLMG